MSKGKASSKDLINQGRILIVDDDEDILVAGRLLLKRHFEKVITVNRPEHIPTVMADTDFDAILLDMNFGAGQTTGAQGLDWLQRILDLKPDAVVILITAHSSIDTAVNAMKLGATDFVSKPWQNEKLIATLNAAVQLSTSRTETKQLKRQNKGLMSQLVQTGQPLLGESQAMKSVLTMIERAAPTEANVLILGENGTGKELVAREIHRQSNRSGGAFMTVDLGAIAETLFDSELFGHKKGAFTDAREDRVGRFEAARGGTLFLDELGNVPLHLQPKLLSALEQRKITPVGSNKSVDIDVRVIGATNLAQNKLTDENIFRQDLLYRLNTVEIHLPPLRDRTDDIPMLVDHFLGEFGRKYSRTIKGVSSRAMDHLMAYAWPGNIRALRHAVERAIILAQDDRLDVQDFSLSQGTPIASGNGAGGGSLPDNTTLEQLEQTAIEKALKKHQGNISHAAKELGVTRASLYRRMEKHGL